MISKFLIKTLTAAVVIPTVLTGNAIRAIGRDIYNGKDGFKEGIKTATDLSNPDTYTEAFDKVFAKYKTLEDTAEVEEPTKKD